MSGKNIHKTLFPHIIYLTNTLLQQTQNLFQGYSLGLGGAFEEYATKPFQLF